MASLELETAGYGLGVAIGLLLMGWAGQAILWRGYMAANHAVGSVSSTPGASVVTAGIFLVGTVIAYTSFVTGLSHALGFPAERSRAFP